MAYPFVQMPTVSEFVHFCEGQGAELRELKNDLVGPRGKVKIQFLYRKKAKERITEPLPTNFNERLTPDTLRRLCRQIGVSVKDFGLHLG